MAETGYNEPNLSLNRIYTKGGDLGETSLVNGRRVSKDDLKIDAYGTIDELNAFIGQARVTSKEAGLDDLATILLRVQHELFNLGSILATDPGKAHDAQPRVTADDVAQLEREIDAMIADLPKLRSFVLAGGCRLDAEIHLARTVCRRAERLLVAFTPGRRSRRRRPAVSEPPQRCIVRLGALGVCGAWRRGNALGAEQSGIRQAFVSIIEIETSINLTHCCRGCCNGPHGKA